MCRGRGIQSKYANRLVFRIFLIGGVVRKILPLIGSGGGITHLYLPPPFEYAPGCKNHYFVGDTFICMYTYIDVCAWINRQIERYKERKIRRERKIESEIDTKWMTKGTRNTLAVSAAKHLKLYSRTSAPRKEHGKWNLKLWHMSYMIGFFWACFSFFAFLSASVYLCNFSSRETPFTFTGQHF